jgi:hypothetical protein
MNEQSPMNKHSIAVNKHSPVENTVFRVFFTLMRICFLVFLGGSSFFSGFHISEDKYSVGMCGWMQPGTGASQNLR